MLDHRHALLVATFASLALAGCSKDGEIKEFITQNDALVAEVVAAAGDPDAAQKVLDAKKGDLQAKLGTVKDARGFQVKEETMTALTQSLTKGVTSVCGLQIKAIMDKTKSTKFKKLCDDYTATMKL